MGKPTGFLDFERKERGYAPAAERVKHWREFVLPLPQDELRQQASRCMSCGIPFCHQGCPVNNQIPDFNELVHRDQWRAALDNLQSTNNFPEFTGRICPAPCEAACTLNIPDTPVTIKSIECQIIDRGWDENWIQPEPSRRGTGKRVGIVGSGPAGLACAQQLARAGHATTVFEKSDRVGGLLRYGIPDFKMEKHLIDRRVRQMEGEGVIFRTGFEVGGMVSVQRLLDDYDVLVMACGAEDPRDLPLPGRDLAGVHFAMEFLTQQNKRNAGDDEAAAAPTGSISAQGKHVVVIGGGDTGSDCIGTSNRQGAASVVQLEIMPMPPEREDKALSWPHWPLKLRTSSSHQEGVSREFAVATKRFIGQDGRVTAIECVRLEWVAGADGRMQMREIAGSEFELKADLVFLAMGFVGPTKAGVVEQSGVDLDPRGNVLADTNDYRTSQSSIFTCGDARRGQSLVVWAIREGRQCARAVDAHLMGPSTLPR
ncbi:MAG: glutamate synthase subunit beta [Alphaproteobacteria bacterium]|nr:glutamate synthase subunit beta [Alphaproteobacteria bacterium]MBU1516779.1 glutamate synthase subunit beta [Alphaproteobacteria bacterium]MBU2092473.1 glutamate synthase subunit beta [Alphaproteobacteria bacterium]MBU2152396.1 glutamate synthase subunit beta [Alphaproteobacteria bacterium]MBU2305607.1 glutamate synthase subunit beta [Alphaproteobacteria bacterium]